MIDALVSGRLASDPKQGTTRTGGSYVTVRLWVDAGQEDRLSVSAIAFDPAACEALLVLTTGDAIAVSGELTPKVWTDREGTARPTADMRVHAVLSAYHVRRRRRAMAADGEGQDGAP